MDGMIVELFDSITTQRGIADLGCIMAVFILAHDMADATRILDDRADE